MSHRGWMDPALPADFLHRVKTLGGRLDALERSPRHTATPVVFVRGDAGTELGDGAWVSLSTSDPVEAMGVVWRGAGFASATRIELGVEARFISSGALPSLTVFLQRVDQPSSRTAVFSETLGTGIRYEVPESEVQPFLHRMVYVDVELTLAGVGTKTVELGLVGPTTFRTPEAV